MSMLLFGSEEGFEHFWANYPRKVDKARARRAYEKARKTVGHGEIAHGLGGWLVYWQRARTEARFIPHPATWLNNERWTVTPPPLPDDQPAGYAGILALINEGES